MFTWIIQTKRRALFAYGVLVGLLLMAATGMLREQLKYDLAAAHKETQRAINALGSLVSEALGHGQYQSLNRLLKEWGAFNTDLTQLEVAGQNGFVISTYRRSAEPVNVLK